MKINKIFANENWVVADKPAGWLTTPARSKDDPRPCLGLILQKEIGHQIFPVHRLDFEVSGLVLFALNANHHRLASGWFEHGVVVKTYAASTVAGRGEPPMEWLEWKSKLLRGKRRSYVSPHGKLSVTKARVVSVGGGADGWTGTGVAATDPSGQLINVWNWELRPLTGRPHQLRVELANHGTPILGDVLYGGPPGKVADSIALRAVSLDLTKISEADRAGLPDQVSLR